MAYGFFKNATVNSEALHTPTTVTIIGRPDVVVATRITADLLSNQPQSRETLDNLALNSRPQDLSSPQKMTAWIHSLTTAIKERALETSVTHLTNPNLWLIHTISEALDLNLNLAETTNNQTLPTKMDPSRNASFTVHWQPHQTLYSVPVELGSYFEFLNQRTSYPTNTLLDEACDAKVQEQIIRIREQNAQLLKLIDATKDKFLDNLTTDEMQAFYLDSLNQSSSKPYPSPTYNGYREALAIGLARASILQDEPKLVGPNDSTSLSF
ncbi:MAG: hypothetical protein K0U37_02815 [Gammaproteobacteria bacterium]|nr:hypothetical protein [Gammaproteobacteria bacterium]